MSSFSKNQRKLAVFGTVSRELIGPEGLGFSVMSIIPTVGVEYDPTIKDLFVITKQPGPNHPVVAEYSGAISIESYFDLSGVPYRIFKPLGQPKPTDPEDAISRLMDFTEATDDKYIDIALELIRETQSV